MLDVSPQKISRPIALAQYGGENTRSGIVSNRSFQAIIGISLGILNLLPIPVLDGGHLLYYLIELVKGSPVSDQTQLAGQYVGLV